MRELARLDACGLQVRLEIGPSEPDHTPDLEARELSRIDEAIERGLGDPKESQRFPCPQPFIFILFHYV